MSFILKFYKQHRTIFNLLFLLAFLYLFLFSLELMGSALKLFGKGFATTLIETTTNPLVGLFIGILATSVIQSSSSTTSIVVGLVAGGALNVANAIPIIMGANIGTSVTNTLASMTQINRSVEFKRAFSAAVVHDFFNLLAVLIIFPLQYFTNFPRRSGHFPRERIPAHRRTKFSQPHQGHHQTRCGCTPRPDRKKSMDPSCFGSVFSLVLSDTNGQVLKNYHRKQSGCLV